MAPTSIFHTAPRSFSNALCFYIQSEKKKTLCEVSVPRVFGKGERGQR